MNSRKTTDRGDYRTTRVRGQLLLGGEPLTLGLLLSEPVRTSAFGLPKPWSTWPSSTGAGTAPHPSAPETSPARSWRRFPRPSRPRRCWPGNVRGMPHRLDLGLKHDRTVLAVCHAEHPTDF